MRWDGNDMKKLFTTITAAALCLSLTACSNPVEPLTSGLDAPVTPVGNYNTDDNAPYTDEGTPAELLNEFTTDDRICNVKVYDCYFEVTLDETLCTPYEAGAAYGKAVNIINPDLSEMIEPYIFENIRMAFPDAGDDYEPVLNRMQSLYDSIDPHYQDEIRGLCDLVCGDVHGICQDGQISVEEMTLMNLTPSALRPTACSGLALWGSKTETGDMMVVRNLEWLLGSDNSMANLHCILHIRNGAKTITNVGFLGLFFSITGFNDSGVMMATLDGDTEYAYDFEGRTCYEYAIRHALETYNNAHDCGQYMTDNAESFTFNHLVFITDGNGAYCAEDAVLQVVEAGTGTPRLRDADTPLMNDLVWESPDSLCCVNSFVTEDNYDMMSGNYVNSVRFSRYNELVCSQDSFSVAELKNAMTTEQVDTMLYGSPIVQNVHRDNLTQMFIIDYHTGNVQIVFTGTEGVTDPPVFTDVGNINDWY